MVPSGSDRLQGQKFPAETVVALKEKAALKDATDLDECADMYVAIAKNMSMTGQKVAVGKSIACALICPQLTISQRCGPECCFHVSVRCERTTLARKDSVRDGLWWWPKLLYHCRVENVSRNLGPLANILT